MAKTIQITREQAEEAMPEWMINDIPALRELYHERLDMRLEMFRAIDNEDAQNRLRDFAREWDIAKHTITLAEAEERWHKTNLRQNPSNYPYRWKSGGAWLTTTYIMTRCFGDEPTT